MMFAARSQHVNQVIKPALDSGTWVICDRFVDASYAYQGGGRGIPTERIRALEEWCLSGFKPDVTLLLDMSVEQGLKRTHKRGKADRFETEKMDFYQSIRRAYLDRAKAEPNRIKVVDSSPGIETVQATIKDLLEAAIKDHQS